MTKSPQELLAERKRRIYDTIALKPTDSVPLFLPISCLGAKYGGITIKEAFENTPKWHDINERLVLEYQPDFFMGPVGYDMETGTILGTKLNRWPGHGVDDNTPFQFVEGEYMRAEEYDEFLDNPADFIMRKYLPRVYSGLEGFQNMPPITSMLTGGGPVMAFSNPAVVNSLKTILAAVESSKKRIGAMFSFGPRMEAFGFPSIFGMGSMAPFDVISDFLRGLKGATLDMYRYPDKLLAVEGKILPLLLGAPGADIGISRSGSMPGGTLGFSPLHRGSDGFMSVKNFEKFYWPGLKAVILDMIKRGIIPFMFFEGTWDQRLEYLADLPKGKILGWFDRTNLFRAKEIIGNTMCICGDMPSSLLQTGTPQQVKDYAKKLIDVVGKGGGFIMGSNCGLDYANPSLVKVWADFTKEYGKY